MGCGERVSQTAKESRVTTKHRLIDNASVMNKHLGGVKVYRKRDMQTEVKVPEKPR